MPSRVTEHRSTRANPPITRTSRPAGQPRPTLQKVEIHTVNEVHVGGRERTDQDGALGVRVAREDDHLPPPTRVASVDDAAAGQRVEVDVLQRVARAPGRP